ncbi:helix-turn-helix transcriptional regulator [Sphingomonas sp. PB2P19]|uniref:helix-turn-helix domain-containing protein n=1 Tax=Sphingomonas rhamnosi TaxID=3096156 RepID=UPI002FCA3E16
MSESPVDQSNCAPTLETDDERKERWKEMGARIKAARGTKSQQSVADELSAIVPETRRRTRAAIAQYESGANPPSFQTMYDLSHVLGVDAEYLIFGGLRSAIMDTTRTMAIDWATRDNNAAMYSLPPSLIAEFGIGEMRLDYLRLAVDASALGAQVGDYVLVDKGGSVITADGRLYALETPAGASLVRAEAIPTSDGTVMLTTGKNATIAIQQASITALGRVVAVIKRNL